MNIPRKPVQINLFILLLLFLAVLIINKSRATIDSININRTLFKLIYKKFYEKILWNSVYYSIIFNSWIIKNNIL